MNNSYSRILSFFYFTPIFLILFSSCEKEEIVDVNKSKINGIYFPSIRESSYSQPPVALRDNHDGSWTGSVAGLELRFYGFTYELQEDLLGNTFPPKTGDPAWPSSIGPEPGVTSNSQFACLRILNDAVYPDNQWTITNTCIFGGTVYVPGNGTAQYHSDVDKLFLDYQKKYDEYKALANILWVVNPLYPQPPAFPEMPDIITYLQKDFIAPSNGFVVFACKFKLIVSPDGNVQYGIIIK